MTKQININHLRINDERIKQYVDTETAKAGKHEIVDSAGTALPPEPNIRFNGLDATDNAQDATSEISAKGLNADDLAEIVSTTPANYAVGNTAMYSTTEQIVGRWIDGKPLYQKTIVGEPLSGIVDGTQSQFNYLIGYNSGDLQYLQIAEANIVSNGKTTTLSLNDAYISGNTVYYIRATLEPINNVENIIIRTNRSAFNTHTPYFTIRYTKTGGV